MNGIEFRGPGEARQQQVVNQLIQEFKNDLYVLLYNINCGELRLLDLYTRL